MRNVNSMLGIAAVVALASAGMGGASVIAREAPAAGYRSRFSGRGRHPGERGQAGSKLAKLAAKGLIGISRIR
jgi:hypothetical protein